MQNLRGQLETQLNEQKSNADKGERKNGKLIELKL